MSTTLEPDVLIVGGGPAGSTAAITLAQAGRGVVLLEKEHHPRFHIGESLLPKNLDLFRRLGLEDTVKAIGVHKPGAEFVSDRTGRSCAFPFAQALNARFTYSYQVPRAAFDDMLFRKARDAGAETREGVRVTDIAFRPGERAEVRAKAGDEEVTYRPRYVLDASGRDAVLAGKMRIKESNKHNNTAAMYAHFKGVERREGDLEGYISVHLAEDGWFWLIPLPNEVMSVGFVGNQSAWKGRKGSAKDLFLERIAGSPTVSARVRDAEIVSEIYATANYSYRCSTGHGDGYLMIGDAYGFVDPMFSTGVLMAMTAGEMGARAADTWLDDPVRGARMARQTNEALADAMDDIGWLIYRINDPVLRSLFLAPRNTLWMRDGIINMLAGNLGQKGFNPRATISVASFKSIYHVLSWLHRRGWGPAVPEALPAPAMVPAE